MPSNKLYKSPFKDSSFICFFEKVFNAHWTEETNKMSLRKPLI